MPYKDNLEAAHHQINQLKEEIKKHKKLKKKQPLSKTIIGFLSKKLKYTKFLLLIISLFFFGFCLKKCYIHETKKNEKQLTLKNKALELCKKKTENRYINYSVYLAWGDYFVCKGFHRTPDNFLEEIDLGNIQLFELEEQKRKEK